MKQVAISLKRKRYRYNLYKNIQNYIQYIVITLQLIYTPFHMIQEGQKYSYLFTKHSVFNILREYYFYSTEVGNLDSNGTKFQLLEFGPVRQNNFCLIRRIRLDKNDKYFDMLCSSEAILYGYFGCRYKTVSLGRKGKFKGWDACWWEPHSSS